MTDICNVREDAMSPTARIEYMRLMRSLHRKRAHSSATDEVLLVCKQLFREWRGPIDGYDFLALQKYQLLHESVLTAFLGTSHPHVAYTEADSVHADLLELAHLNHLGACFFGEPDSDAVRLYVRYPVHRARSRHTLASE